MSSRPGVEMRCVARMVGQSDNLFIAGNALELVVEGSQQGEKHTFSRIFDMHASDKEVYDMEVEPLLKGLVAGENVSIIVMGHHKSGHAELTNYLLLGHPEAIVEKINDLMRGRQSTAGGEGRSLK